MESPKDNDKHLRQSHSLSILPSSKVVLTRTRGLSFESANVDQCHFSGRMSRCLCERMNDEKSEFRRRSFSVVTKMERPKKKKSKVVRFADTLGLECAITVREYNVDEVPEVHPSLSRKDHSRDYVSIQEESLTFKYNFTARDQSWHDQRVLTHNVSLFKIHISEDLLSGLVLITNLSPEKSLFVRWTHDLWATFTDSYSYFCSKFNNTVDQFSFQIILPPSVMVLGGSMEFALCFKCQSKEFWDNNNGENYRLLRTLCPYSKK